MASVDEMMDLSAQIYSITNKVSENMADIVKKSAEINQLNKENENLMEQANELKKKVSDLLMKMQGHV